MEYLETENDYMRALQDLNEELCKLLNSYSEALSRAEHLENYKPTKLADIRNQLDQGKTPQAKLDALARSDSRFKRVLTRVKCGEEESHLLQG